MKPIAEGRAVLRVTFRLFVFALVAFLWTIIVGYEGWALSPDLIRQVYGPKLTYMGLVIALGTFQYRIFFELALKLMESLQDPKWHDYERKLEEIRPKVDRKAVEGLEAPLKGWRDWVNDNKQHARRSFIPHNEAIVVNVFALVGSLLISVVTDIVLLIMWPNDRYSLRVLSTALFTFSFLPFLSTVCRYLIVFCREVQFFYDSFK